MSTALSHAQTKESSKGNERCGDTLQLVRKSERSVLSPKQMKAVSVLRVSPKFPKACRCQGTVVIQLVVNADGTVECAQNISGHPLLVSAAKDAAKQWKFKPMKRDENPVAFVGLLAFSFKSYGAVSF